MQAIETYKDLGFDRMKTMGSVSGGEGDRSQLRGQTNHKRIKVKG